MNTKLIILGCGSSIGVPRIDGYWGNCDKNNIKNKRSRCSAIIICGTNNILIDTLIYEYNTSIKNKYCSTDCLEISSMMIRRIRAKSQTNVRHKSA